MCKRAITKAVHSWQHIIMASFFASVRHQTISQHDFLGLMTDGRMNEREKESRERKRVNVRFVLIYCVVLSASPKRYLELTSKALKGLVRVRLGDLGGVSCRCS